MFIKEEVGEVGTMGLHKSIHTCILSRVRKQLHGDLKTNKDKCIKANVYECRNNIKECMSFTPKSHILHTKRFYKCI